MRHRFDSADALLVVTVVLWSFNFVAVKYALTHGFAPLVYAALRFGAGSLIFAGIAYGRERTLRVERRDAVLLLGLVALAMFVNQISFATGAKLTSASTLALLFGTLPIFVGIMGWKLGSDRPHARHWVAAGISFAGVALVASGAQGGLSGDLGGILIGLVAPITWAYYSVVVAPLMQRYSPYRISAVVGLAAMLPLFAVAAPSLADEDWSSITPLAWGAFLYSMLLSFVLTNVLWFTAIERVGPNRSSVYANLQPFLGALFAVVVLSETLGTLQAIGGGVIAVGIILARSRRAPVEIVD